MLVPSEALQQLVCSKCGSYLSVFPVRHNLQDGNVICGRCADDSTANFRREATYEIIAEHLEFPCRYKNEGCIETLKPKDLKQHETACKHRTYDCPSEDACNWRGKESQLVEHFESSHSQSLINNSFDVDVTVSNGARKMFLLQLDEAFIFRLYFGDDYINYSISCYCLAGHSHEVTFSEGQYTIKGPQGVVMHEPQCSTTSIFYPYIDFDVDNVSCRIDIRRETCQPTEIPAAPLDDEEMPETINGKLLKSLECPVCLLYMTPPIMQCERGHSTCLSCSDQLANCPLCHASFTDKIRNYLLENICSYIEYPCINREYRCPVMVPWENMKAHEKECKYRPYNCPVNRCNTKHSRCMLIDHVRNQHQAQISDSDTSTYNYTYGPISKYHFCIYDGNIFKIYFESNGSSVRWCLQITGDDDPNKYMLEIDIASSQSNERIFVRKLCCPPLENNAGFSYEHGFILLNKDCIKKFIVNDILQYRFYIVKNS